VVVGVVGAASASSLSEWKYVTSSLLEAANQARDTTLYLKSFQKSVDKLARCTMVTADDVNAVCGMIVPGVLKAAEVVHSMSSYYQNKVAFSILLRSVSLTVMDKCNEYILLSHGMSTTTISSGSGGGGKGLWEQPYASLVAKLDNVLRICREFATPALQLLDGSADASIKQEHGQDPCHINFPQFSLFKGRCEKLHTFFSIISQFHNLSQKTSGDNGRNDVVPGMEAISTTFQSLLADVKSKRMIWSWNWNATCEVSLTRHLLFSKLWLGSNNFKDC
jgi:hypothetical protein